MSTLGSLLRSNTITRAPSALKRWTIAAPMPAAPPVTMVVLPSSPLTCARAALLPVRREGGLLLLGLEKAQHRRPFEDAVGTTRAGLVEVRGFFQCFFCWNHQVGPRGHRIHLRAARELELVHRVERFGNARPAGEQPVRAQDHRVVLAKVAHQALLLR